VSRYQKCKTDLDITEARDSEWQWHQLGHMQVCTSPQTDKHASTPPLSFLQAGCPSCRPTNSVKALKALAYYILRSEIASDQQVSVDLTSTNVFARQISSVCLWAGSFIFKLFVQPRACRLLLITCYLVHLDINHF